MVKYKTKKNVLPENMKNHAVLEGDRVRTLLLLLETMAHPSDPDTPRFFCARGNMKNPLLSIPIPHSVVKR